MNKFWNFVEGEDCRELFLDGVIAEESWWGDEVTPKAFKEELEAGKGNIIVWINSQGGDVFAASQLYTMLKEYEGEVTVKINGLAASAASVVAMAGDKVCMSPTAIMMIHNPSTLAYGDTAEMQKTIDILSEVKESIINAYVLKTGMKRDELSDLMDAETYMNAYKAVELGFADEVMYADGSEPKVSNFSFSRRSITNSLLGNILTKVNDKVEERVEEPIAVQEGDNQPLADITAQTQDFIRIKKKLLGENE